MHSKSPLIVLASSSPRRRELLDQIGISYVVRPTDTDERRLPGEDAVAYVRRVAADKTQAAVERLGDGLPVLGADTSVVLDGEILGKPAHRDEAMAMLSRLSGRSHHVYSAVSLRTAEGHWQALSRTVVNFREIGRDEMEAYWRSDEPLDKAGGYAIQGLGAVFVRSIEGSFSGVVGLPLYETSTLLQKAGIFTLKVQV